MSNGDDVLDNWEEIDEVGLDSKLNKLKEGKKTQLEQEEFLTTEEKFFDKEGDIKLSTSRLQQAHQEFSTSSPLDDMSSFQNTVPLMMVLHKSDDEYQSANYMQPTKSQTVKILRRPTQSNEARGNGIRPKQPIKTLQQREQEYAEARLRILGSAKNPEDEAESSSATKLPQMEATNNIYNNNAINSATVGSFAASTSIPLSMGMMPIVGATTATTTTTTNIDVVTTGFGGAIMIPQTSQILRQQQENIVRLPKGPDGSLGFQIRR